MQHLTLSMDNRLPHMWKSPPIFYLAEFMGYLEGLKYFKGTFYTQLIIANYLIFFLSGILVACYITVLRNFFFLLKFPKKIIFFNNFFLNEKNSFTRLFQIIYFFRFLYAGTTRWTSENPQLNSKNLKKIIPNSSNILCDGLNLPYSPNNIFCFIMCWNWRKLRYRLLSRSSFISLFYSFDFNYDNFPYEYLLLLILQWC